jgi:hypothetical protein
MGDHSSHPVGDSGSHGGMIRARRLETADADRNTYAHYVSSTPELLQPATGTVSQ